jgi:hypothetical protein
VQVPIYCLSAPINMVKEAHGRESPAEWSEPVEGGAELALRLRLSTACRDLDLAVCARHTIAQCKNKLHVSFFSLPLLILLMRRKARVSFHHHQLINVPSTGVHTLWIT